MSFPPRSAASSKPRCARASASCAPTSPPSSTQDDPRLVGLRNRMEETDDWAAADAMAAQDIALVSRDLAELADVEQALARIADGSYGECADCGNPIPYARLAAYPAAKRCVALPGSAERLETRPQVAGRRARRRVARVAAISGRRGVSAAAPPRRRASRREAREPGEELAVPEPRVLRLQDPVVLVGKVDEPRGDVLRLQRIEVLQSPASRARDSRARRG